MNKRIAVIGASTAGLYTAARLAQAGLAVEVFETAGVLSPKKRTLIVTHHFAEFLGPLAQACTLNEIKHLELLSNGDGAKITLRDPDVVIDRAIVIQGLAQQATAAGAKLNLGHRLTNMEQSRGKLLCTISHQGTADTREFDVVIGADGAFSGVAQHAGWGQQPTAPLLQAVVDLPADYPRDVTRVWFEPSHTPYFYWSIPEADGRGAVGFIAENGSPVSDTLRSFLDRKGFHPIEYQAARVPVYRRWIPLHRRLGKADVYLVGDAAGHVKVTTVGGIVTGFRGAAAVVEAVLNDGPAAAVANLKRELDWHLRIRKALHHFSEAEYSTLLKALNSGARSVLSEVSRDRPRDVVLRACLSQPRLLLMGLRSLLSPRRAF